MFPVTILLAVLPLTVASNSIDWCEYWARVANQNEYLKTERPECAGYELPAGVKRAETFSCSKTEMYNCLDCEPTCHNLVPKCRKEQCNKGCVCKTGLARNSEGKCVSFRECAAHTPPKNDSVKGDDDEGTVMKTVKKMVPVIVNDVWKALFNSISIPDSPKTLKKVTPALKPVNGKPERVVENIGESQNFTGFPIPPSTEIKNDKHPQKGFYIDYP